MDEKDLALRDDDSLLSLAITKGVDTDQLEKLIALRNAEIARRAKDDFDKEFALMQAEFRPVGKTNRADDRDGNMLYSYCPIEVILQMAAPIIAKHGFAYSWEEEALPNKEKRIWCVISGYGHERRGYVDIPFMEPSTRATNAVQMRGSATTYGKRYSFLNATGIIVGGEDNDALSNSAPGSVKVEVVDDDPGEAPDPLKAVKAEIKGEIARFVALCGAEFQEAAYFTDAEKADFKAKIAAINEGAKAEKDVGKGLEIKLKDVRTLNNALREELNKRKGGSSLANAMKDALHDKAHGGEQQELG
jgi:ERF superfamily